VRHEKRPILVFDPRGFVDVTIARLAPRKTSLEGLRLGILDNSKWNANKLLRGASVALGKDIKLGNASLPNSTAAGTTPPRMQHRG
jgi:hypothetical protein